jgi:hypothetical protein
MSINRYFVNAIVIFIILFLTACGSKPDNQSQFPNSTSTITASPDYGSEIGSYQVVFSIKSLEHSSQEEIATKLFNLYLEHFKSEAVDIRIRLQDFKIQEVTIPPEFQYCAKGLGMEFIPYVKFSILPLRTPAPDWDAGSGISGNNNWIIDKIAYIGIFITKDSYSFRLLGVPPCINVSPTPTATFTTTIQSATSSPSLEYSTKFPVIVSITPSSVPLGIFSLLFYRPLVMVYDVTQWEDITPYNQPNAIAKNYLQSKKKSSCKIGVQGPINFNDPSQYKSEEAHLGNINYEVKIFSNNPDRSITTFYIDDKSIKGFNYENAFPVLSVQSDENEWKDCRRFAETILSTLSLP